MSRNTSHSLTPAAPRFLDLSVSLASGLTSGLTGVETAGAETVSWVVDLLAPPANLPPFALLLLADRLAALYALAFPEEEGWLDEVVGAWTDEADVEEALGRFLQRVNQRLFPVWVEVWEIELEAIEWRLYEIPLLTLGFDIWDEGWDDFPEPIPYLLHLIYGRWRGNDMGQDEFAALYPEHPVPYGLEPQRLATASRSLAGEAGEAALLPAPLDALPDLIAMLCQDTGNIFLDVGEMGLAEGGGHPDWTAENVALLAAQWREAEPLWGRIQRLLAWQGGTPEEVAGKLTAVRRALLAAWGELELEGEEEEA